MNVEEQIKLAVEALDDAKAKDIEVLDVKGISNVTDAMVIATGTSSTHARSCANKVSVAFKEIELPPIGIEGEDEGQWVLLDLGDVIVHVMQAEAREFYALEKLWGGQEA